MSFGGKAYAISDFMISWNDADFVCVRNNATLASSASQLEDEYLRNLTRNLAGSVSIIILFTSNAMSIVTPACDMHIYTTHLNCYD